MKYSFITLILLLSLACTGQTQNASPGAAPWQITGMIRKGLDTKDDKDKPAILSLTWPQDDKENSYLVNAAAAISFIQTKRNSTTKHYRRLELAPTFAYNRNNQIKKEQYNYKFMIAGDYLLGIADVPTRTHSYFKAYPTVQLMNNKKDTSKSFFATAYFTWVAKTSSKIFLNNYTDIANSGLLYFFGPAVGLEYQDRFDVKKAGTQGSVTRFYFGGDFRLALKTGGSQANRAVGFKKLETVITYAGRKELQSSISEPENYLFLFKTELNYFPLRSEDISLGLSYNKGEDPIAAVEKQNFWLFAIKVKFDVPIKR